MSYEYDDNMKQYRRSKGEEPVFEEVQEVKEVSEVDLSEKVFSRGGRRSRSTHRKREEGRKRLKALFWVVFTLGVSFWLLFMVYVFKSEGGGGKEKQVSPLRSEFPGLLP